MSPRDRLIEAGQHMSALVRAGDYESARVAARDWDRIHLQNRWTVPPGDQDPDEMTAADIEQQAYDEWKRDMYADVDKGFYE